jgi:hypothetical protein
MKRRVGSEEPAVAAEKARKFAGKPHENPAKNGGRCFNVSRFGMIFG